jgi:prepilin-type N-terminal cleavage/methylation domain-containing protein/prepilin-type processing-associated H-X9-DG protein
MTYLARQQSHSRLICELRRPFARRGVTLVELIIVVAILCVLLGILMPVFAKVRRSSRSVQCISTLRNIGGAFQSYALSNQGRLPDPSIADKSWEQIILPFFSGPFKCAEDCELYPAVGSSYDWRDTGVSSTTMAGKLLADTRRSDAVLAFESLPGWHEKGYINVVFLDGSVHTMDELACFKDLECSLRDADASAGNGGSNARSTRSPASKH